MPHAQPISFFLIWSPGNIWWGVHIIKLLSMHGNASSSLTAPNTFLSTHPPLEHPQPVFACTDISLKAEHSPVSALNWMLYVDQHHTKGNSPFYGGEYRAVRPLRDTRTAKYLSFYTSSSKRWTEHLVLGFHCRWLGCCNQGCSHRTVHNKKQFKLWCYYYRILEVVHSQPKIAFTRWMNGIRYNTGVEARLVQCIATETAKANILLNLRIKLNELS